MNVVYAANENYVEHLCASLISLLENNKKELKIYIVSVGISKKSKKILSDTALIYNKSLNFINFEDISKKFTYKPDTSRFDITALGRLFLGELLPKNIEKVIYLDCDTIILRDLSALFRVDLKSKLLGAVPEPTVYPRLKTDIGMYKDAIYYNSGVLLIDLKQWRETEATKSVVNYLESINDCCLFADQDAINGAFMNRIHTLSPKYNFFSNYKYWRYEDLVKLSPSYRLIPKANFESAKAHPALVHFAGDERPWKTGSLNYYKKAYRKYKKLSYFAAYPLEKANVFYMFAYHCMNLITPIFPWLRLYLSETFYKKIRKEKLSKNAR